MGIGQMTRWKHDEPGRLVKALWIPFLLSVVTMIAAILVPSLVAGGSLLVPLGLGLAAWVLFSHLTGLWERLRHRRGIRAMAAELASGRRSYYGMLLAHLGVAAFIVGATMVSHFGIESDVRMAPGDIHEEAGYRFRFDGVKTVPGPNYRASQGHFLVFRGDERIAELRPQKRSYLSGGMPMTEAAIDWGFTRDLYVSLGEPLEDGAWALRIYYKPYVRWIWLGGVLMALGGILAVTDRRYRIQARKVEAPAGTAVARA
jgi:cytochrome c-type biogenesis protein CcmF